MSGQALDRAADRALRGMAPLSSRQREDLKVEYGHRLSVAIGTLCSELGVTDPEQMLRLLADEAELPTDILAILIVIRKLELYKPVAIYQMWLRWQVVSWYRVQPAAQRKQLCLGLFGEVAA